MVEDIDSDGNGTVEFKEFMGMMTGKMGEKDSREDVVKVFAMFDDDSTNKISFRNLARAAEELQDMINQSDKDGDGEINFDEFYRIMKEKGNFLEDLSSDDDMEAAPKKSSRRYATDLFVASYKSEKRIGAVPPETARSMVV